jgi:hypothetical protein
LTISGSLFVGWTVSDNPPNHFGNTLELYKYVPVGKSVAYIPLKFELTCSRSLANPLPNIHYYNPPNTAFLIQCSQVGTVSKWNALLGKETTNQRETHVDNNGEEDNSLDDNDGIHRVVNRGMTESSQAEL